jgi:hypothetical protein
LASWGRLVLQTKMEEYTTCARVCPGCMKLRRQRDSRTHKVQTLSGRSLSLAEFLPDRCGIGEPGRGIPKIDAEPDLDAGVIVLIDGVHIRAAHGYQTRHIDVTVGKIEVPGRPPRRFALATKGAVSPFAGIRQALKEQGWQPGSSVTVLNDGEVALPGLIRAAVGEPINCILDWWHILIRVQHIRQPFGVSTRSNLNTTADWIRWH